MPFENLPQTRGSRAHPISPGLRRALVFAWLGPVFGLLVAFSLKAVADGGYPTDVGIGIVIVFFFSLVVCPIAGTVDGVLACVVPIFLRAPLTAIVGAAVAVGLSLYLWIQVGNKMVPPSLYSQIPIAVVGALTAGACS